MSTAVHQLEGSAPNAGRGSRVGRPLAAAGRLLRLELRRNAMLWLLPLMVGLFLLDQYRTAVGYPPFWAARSSAVPASLHDFAPFVAGVAAWTAAREGRRHTSDLVAATSRSRWTAQLLGWAASWGWAMVAYAVCVAVLYGTTATQATWGGPLWWPVAVGAAGLAAFSAVGYLAGAFWPSRFTAPLVALAATLALLIAFRIGLGHTSGVRLLSPETTEDLMPGGAGIFYPYPPDLLMVQTMFLGGLAVAVLGALGLPRRSGARRLRRVALALTVAGLAALGVAVGLAGTARLDAQGIVVPALHAAASNRPIPYSPLRVPAAVPLYLHPAYHAYASLVTAALDPALREVAGLPGAPARVVQVGGRSRLGGDPSVYDVSVVVDGPASADLVSMRLAFVDAFAGGDQGPSGPGGRGPLIGGPAQQAVEIALLQLSGLPLLSPGAAYAGGMVQAIAPPPGSPVSVAARRFAALSPAARHAWLAAHLTELRAGKIGLAQLP